MCIGLRSLDSGLLFMFQLNFEQRRIREGRNSLLWPIHLAQ